jgi:hypothetical protein
LQGKPDVNTDNRLNYIKLNQGSFIIRISRRFFLDVAQLTCCYVMFVENNEIKSYDCFPNDTILTNILADSRFKWCYSCCNGFVKGECFPISTHAMDYCTKWMEKLVNGVRAYAQSNYPSCTKLVKQRHISTNTFESPKKLKDCLITALDEISYRHDKRNDVFKHSCELYLAAPQNRRRRLDVQ